MVTVNDYVGITPAWCPGCGNFGIQKAVKRALVALEIEPYQVLFVSGIGQSGKLPHYVGGNIFNSLHGRPVPAAIGARIANGELTVIAVSGDGDGYGEGGNHFLHAMRRNHDITYLVHNNQVYGLTKGQASPTSDPGYVTKTTPFGASEPLHPVTLALAGGASFVARSFAGDIEHLSGMIQEGIKHKGFALIDILQPCVSFNHKNTWKWYRDRVYHLEDDYDPSDMKSALDRAQEWEDKIPIGVLYRRERPTFEDQQPALGAGTLAGQKLDPAAAAALLEEFV